MAIVTDEGQGLAFWRGGFGEDDLWLHGGWGAFFKGKLYFWQERGRAEELRGRKAGGDASLKD